MILFGAQFGVSITMIPYSSLQLHGLPDSTARHIEYQSTEKINPADDMLLHNKDKVVWKSSAQKYRGQGFSVLLQKCVEQNR